MNEDARTLEKPEDAGEGPRGVVKRWLMALEIAGNEEKAWRKAAAAVVRRYRDEDDKGAGKSRENDSEFNILWANTELLRPSLYSNTPNPDIRRRNKDADPLGREISEVLERACRYTVEDGGMDDAMELGVLDYLLTGRAITRVRYAPVFQGEGEDRTIAFQRIDYEPVQFERFRRGPGDKWSDVRWMAFEHHLKRKEIDRLYPKMSKKVELDVTTEDGKDREEESELFGHARVWEIWDAETRTIIHLAPSCKDGPLKVDNDTLGLRDFFPIPRPLYSMLTHGNLVPVEEYRLYRDQAEELTDITRRIRRLVKGLKVRGIYDAALAEIGRLMDANDGEMIPSEGATSTLANTQTLERHIWMFPIDTIARVLQGLYEQRDQIKATIYEITGLSDVLRGATDANETLGAQQLKAQTGSLRLQRRQRDVARYARDMIEMTCEIIAEHFDPQTLQLMTGKDATQMLPIIREQGLRDFRIDVETDSTIAGDQSADQEAMTNLLGGMAQFVQSIGPAVEAGHFPAEAAKKILNAAIRRARFGREVEDALDDEEQNNQQQAPSPEELQMQAQQMQEQAMQQAQQFVEKEQAKLEGQKGQLASTQAQIEAQKAAVDSVIGDIEKQRAAIAEDVQKGMQALDAEREKVAVEKKSAQADIGRELVKIEQGQKALSTLKLIQSVEAKLAKSQMQTGEEGSTPDDDTQDMLAQLMEAQTQALASLEATMAAPKELIRDAKGRPTGSRTVMDA